MRLALFALLGTGALVGCNRPAPPRAAPATAAAMPTPVPAQEQVLQVPAPPDEPDEGPLPDELRQEAIPQDRERMKMLRAERLARSRASTVEAYGKVGSRNAAWDKSAEDGLTNMAEVLARDYQDPDREEAAWEALRAAVRAGCDDPLVRYMYQRLFERRSPPAPKDRGLEVDVARALRDSRYPAIRRAKAAHNLAVNLLKAPPTADAVEALLDHADCVRVRELLREAWADDPRWTAETLVELAGLTQGYCSLPPGGRRQAYRAFGNLAGELPGANGLAEWLTGQYHLDRALAVGRGGPLELTPADEAAVADGLDAAAEAFEAAWKADPTRPEVAVGMMKVAARRGEADELEYWFRLALSVDGDNVAACREKGNALMPWRGGHSAAVRQFAARLADTKNFHGRLPYVGVQLVTRLRSQSDRETADVNRADWALVERVFTDYLDARPDSRWAATRFLWFGWHQKRYAAALKAADRLDGRPFERLMDRQQYDSIREFCRKSVADGHR